ncbi:MAG TPA: hypothetical protein VLV76_14935 [Candidatus Acidoferrum sp.]|nr:hypothetical protein [Candidatus Acidoferrum sp.]
MAGALDQLRRSAPDLAKLDPLSTEVSEWLDRAHDAVKDVDEAEAVILRMQQRYLLDPAAKIVASAEILDTVERAANTSAVLRRAGVGH